MVLVEQGLSRVGKDDLSTVIKGKFPIFCGKVKIRDFKLTNGSLTNGTALRDRLLLLDLVSEDYVIRPDPLIVFDVVGEDNTKFVIRYCSSEKESASRILKSYEGKSLSELVFKGGKKFKHVKCHKFRFTPLEIHYVTDTCYFHFKKA